MVFIIFFLQLALVLLELYFKTEVGTDTTAPVPDEVDGSFKGHLVFLHEVGDDEGGRLQ